MLKGLNAVDVGGPYRSTRELLLCADVWLCREVLFQICRELQSPVLPLFIPTPNTRDQLGKNQSDW